MADPRTVQTEYSTLEVAPYQGYHGGDENLPEIAYDHAALSQPQVVTGPEAGFAAAAATPDKLAAVNAYGYVPDGPPGPSGPPEVAAAKPPARWCGLSRKALWILVVVGVIIVAGLVGGLAGGLTARSNSNSSGAAASNSSGSDNGTTTTSATNPLYGSKITALNWTDTSDVSRRTIFYQYSDSLFINDYYDNAWVTYNLSDLWAKNNSGDALDVKANTPLSVAAPSIEDIDYLGGGENRDAFVIALYYLDSNNYLQELITSDITLAIWSQGALSSTTIKAASNSNLAAVAFYCPNSGASWVCNNNMALMYQNPDGEIMRAGGSVWTNDDQDLDTGATGSGLAFVNYNSNSGANFTDVSELRAFYVSDSTVKLNVQNSGGLVAEGAELSSQYSTDDQAVEIVACPAEHHSRIILISKDGSSQYTATLDKFDTFSSSQHVTFTNEDGTSTSGEPAVSLQHLTMDNNGTFYGISNATNNRIVSYSWSLDNPFTLTWKANIDITI